jgi:hypothetical protein
MVGWLKKDEFENSGLIAALFQNLPVGYEEDYKNVRLDSDCPGRDSNRAPTEYKYRALLYQPDHIQRSL